MNRVVILRAIVLTLVVISYFLLQNMLGEKSKNNGLENAFCNFHASACYFEYNPLKVGLDVSDPALPLETELIFSLVGETEKLTVKSAYIHGVNMYMGKIPLLFKSDSDGDSFNATVMLGMCSEPNMQWQLTVNVLEQLGNEHQLIFFFNTNN